MRVYGIDFTSRPRRRKPITCLECNFDGGVLRASKLHELHNFQEFEVTLCQPGAWIAGIDFPFGMARRFIETIKWPTTWQGYVEHIKTLTRNQFRQALDNYRAPRPEGDKEHRRATDVAAGSVSPQKLYGVPVGLMFFEGAPRLRAAKVTIPGLQNGDPTRIVVEAYPGVLARSLIGPRSYKQDTKAKQTDAQHKARRDLMAALLGGKAQKSYGARVEASPCFADDPSGDQIDALLCAIQAAWAWNNQAKHFGAPSKLDQLEGWIADPHC
jgi:hypothetical protein